ncbi:MAG: hypothetical protein PQ964_01545 [Methanobacteriaceae archaeon]|jgi:small basic protein
MDKENEKSFMVTIAIFSALVIMGGIVATIYLEYPFWSWVGFGTGLFLGDWISWKKFGLGTLSDWGLDIGIFIALGFVFTLFIIEPIHPYITPATIATISAIGWFLIGTISLSIIRYLRTRSKKEMKPKTST